MVIDPAYRSTEIGIADRSADVEFVTVSEADAKAWSDSMADAINTNVEPIEAVPDEAADHSLLRARLDILERM